MTAVSSSRLNMDALQNVLECLIIDGVKTMEFQHIIADVETEIFLDLAAQGFRNFELAVATRDDCMKLFGYG
jgi:hypothetical protein